MGKLLLAMSFLVLGLLFIFGLYAPSNPIVWLASDSSIFGLLRAVLMIAVLYLIIFGVPNKVNLHTFLGATAGILGIYTGDAFYLNYIQLEDALALLLTSISFAIAVLETPIIEDTYELPKKSTSIAKHRLATNH
jgi:hypothetical protein